MTTIKGFQFETTTKEIEVNGHAYKVDFSDDAMNRYMEVGAKMQKVMIAEQTMIESFGDDLPVEAIKETQIKQREAVKEVLEAFLGEGTFDSLYDMSGRSIINLLALVEYLNTFLDEQTFQKIEAKKEKYLKNKKAK
jgi:hypothetical protein